MKMGAHPAIAKDVVRYVGDAVAVVIAETKHQARDAAERVDGRLRGAAGRHRSGEGAWTPGAPQLHPEAPKQPDLRLGDRRRGGDRRGARQGRPRRQARHRQQPPRAQRDGAARGARRLRPGRGATSRSTPPPRTRMSRRLVLSAFFDIAPENKLRVIAPDVGGGFGSKIFIYPEEIVCLWASKKVGGRPVKWTADRTEVVPDRRAWPRPCHPRRDGLRRQQQDHRPQGRHDRQFRRLHVDSSRRRCRPISTRTLLSGQYDIPAIYCRGRRGLHQHRAGRRRSRRRPARRRPSSSSA